MASRNARLAGGLACFSFLLNTNMEAGPSASPNSSELRTGYRYLQAKNGQPLRLRYIGPLPPSSAEASQIWYGVEYDDPSRGKGHPGTFEGTAVFHTQQEGAGAFIKAGPKPIFEQGKTFLQAVADRYGALNPEVGAISSSSVDESILLGSSNSSIKVEAPNIQDVQKRVGRLEKLREMGLEGEWVNGVGGDEEMRRKVRERLGSEYSVLVSR